MITVHPNTKLSYNLIQESMISCEKLVSQLNEKFLDSKNRKLQRESGEVVNESV